MYTVTAFKWVPDFARGQVRDLRVRWALREAGEPYRVRLLDFAALHAAEYRAQQPFGQVPVLEKPGCTLFESGAIVLDIASRSAALLPDDPDARALAISWLFAALNSIEPVLMNLAEVDLFMTDEELKARRRPGVAERAAKRLGELQTALGDADFLGKDFSAADLMMATVLRIVGRTDVLDGLPALAAYQARCEARPAFQAALAEQLADFTGDGPG